MTTLESNAECIAASSIRWAMRPDRLDQMRACVNRLNREEVLEVLRGVNRLQTELLDRLKVTTDEVLAAHEEAEFGELVAMAALTPDALPDDMGDGYAINGRLPQRLAEPCAYCGEQECPDRFEHDRADAGSETTWMRRARS